MMKTLFRLCLLVFLVLSSAQFGERGLYVPLTRTIICHERGQCLHEIGHASDHALGWISDGKEFRDALFYFTYIDHALALGDNHEWTGKILFYPCFFSPCLRESNPLLWSYWRGWGGARELYADMLLWSDGDPANMPMEFREFYDWELAEELTARHIER